MMSNQPVILLTGSRGMVGQNILSHPEASSYTWLTPSKLELNLNELHSVKDYFKKFRPDAVIHAAGKVGGIQDNIANPVRFLVDNLDMGLNLIMTAREANIKTFLNLASSCIYPKDAKNPLTENMILEGSLEPTNEGYALAKIAALKLCEYINKEDQSQHFKTLIPCNLYGRFDKFDPKHSHLVPAIIHKIHNAKVGNDKTVTIWGDGLARREFMDASDLAHIILQSLKDFERLPSVMNVGVGYDYTINEYYKIAAEVIDWHGEFIHDKTKPAGMLKKLVSIDRMKALGFKATTTLKEGMLNAYAFYLEYHHEH
jgi:GDP-L-fucose synthase